jgi:hypothetical protein
VPIDYRTEDFLARVRQLTGDGVDVVLDGLGGATSLRSFRALHCATLAHGRKSWQGWIEWYGTTAGVALWGLLSPRRRVLAYRIQKLRDSRQWLPVAGRRPARLVGGGPRYPHWFREDLLALLELLRGDKIHQSWPIASRCPTLVAPTSCWSNRRRRESSSSSHKPRRTLADGAGWGTADDAHVSLPRPAHWLLQPGPGRAASAALALGGPSDP